MKQELISKIKEFVLRDINLGRHSSSESNELWAGLKKAGSEIWLDTGDIDEASRLWCSEMSALTTNNTLLNKEIQKGIYDDLIPEAAGLLEELDAQAKVIEIAFILNAKHALKLVERFGGKVSVELHTDMAHDIDRSVAYAERFFDICPDHFIIKIPLTPSGFIATRRIREKGIPVNFTLNFSARHNLVACIFSKPSYVNVFLGRQNAFVADNRLGDGKMIGEKSLLASQRVVTEYSKSNPEPTKQIAASIRDSEQIFSMSGVDVFTIPTKVAGETLKKIGPFKNNRDKDYAVHIAPEAELSVLKIEKLWQYSEAEHNFAHELDARPPGNANEFLKRAHTAGLENLFPVFSAEENKQIASDGKIPVYQNWKEKLANNSVSVDALLNAAGLASFAEDQKSLDDRIRAILKK